MKLAKSLLIATAISGLISTTSFASSALAKKGEKIFNTKKLGNCLACHAVNGKKINDPGSFGPALSGLAYYPDDVLYGFVYDIYEAKGIKVTAMPAFGKTGILDDSEIKAIVAYLKTIQ